MPITGLQEFTTYSDAHPVSGNSAGGMDCFSVALWLVWRSRVSIVGYVQNFLAEKEVRGLE